MGKKVLLGCTGSVATIKTLQIAKGLIERGHQVKVVATERAMHFLKPEEAPEVTILRDEDEWSAWQGRGDPVLHVDLRKWADVLVIAPLDANTLAKLAGGLCDNLLMCVCRAWDFSRPRLFAPAMNTHMWEHPLTLRHRQVLTSELGWREIPCVAKVLVCGDRGLGAMAEVGDVVAAVNAA